MTDRVRSAALAGAVVTVGCIVAAMGAFALLSLAFCPPYTPATVNQGCVPANAIPWYGLVLTAAIAAVGVAVAVVGFILYRRAKAQAVLAASAPK